jgi:hypothetical protein
MEAVGDNLLEMRFLPLAAALALFLGPRTVFCETQAAPSDTLQRASIHAEYGDGNFETVIKMLEEYRTQHRDFRPQDSLFVAKYLGVVYASNPATREKGKYWLYRMLQIDPGSQLVDMYVGEEVDRTFEKVRQEFIVRRNYRGINDTRLNRAIEEGDRPRDTVVVRDTVKLPAAEDSLPERRLKDFRYGWTGNLNLGVGLKFMDEDEWDATSKQKEMRIAFDVRQRRWPINIAFDFMYSKSEDVYTWSENNQDWLAYNQSSYELNAGVRKIFDQKLYSMRPFVGGGVGYISTSLDFASFLDKFNQGTVGAWAEGGVYWELERHFNIGAEFLWSWAQIPVLAEKANAGGKHFEMVVGYHW